MKDTNDTDTMAPIKVAVLDDYQGLSEPKFKALDPAKFETTFIKDTLPPWNHPDTTQAIKAKLVSRLEPFDVIGKHPPTPIPTPR